MSESSTGTAVIALAEIREWLLERVGFYLEIPRAAIDPDAGLVELGLDSVYAVTLSGDVAEQFGVDLEPTIAWDHDTVNKLAAFVADEMTASRERDSASRIVER